MATERMIERLPTHSDICTRRSLLALTDNSSPPEKDRQIQDGPDGAAVLQIQAIDGVNDVHLDSILPGDQRKTARILVLIGRGSVMLHNGYGNLVQPA